MTQDSALTPKQARSRESQRRILAATLALLDHSHFEAITIAQIAAEAGMAVGNFYKRFKNKEALLPHLYDEYNRRFAVFAQALQASSSKNPWRLIVQRTVVFFSENKGLIRALHLHSRLNPDVVPHGSSQAREKLYRAFEPLVTKRGLSARSRSVRARTVALVMVASITEAILYPDMTPAAVSQLDESLLVRELTILLQGYCE